jgi:hypothetical protein
MRAADPVAAHVAELERTLRGPAKDRLSMIREVRDGLEDAAEAYSRRGLDRGAAARRAVREFGPVAEVAPQFQDELAAGQGRRTALLLAMALPALTLGWDLLWQSGFGWRTTPAPAVPAVKALAGVQDMASATVAAVALALVVLASRRTLAPRPVAAAAAAVALLAVVVIGGAAIAIANVQESRVLLGRPVVAAAYLVSFAVLAQLVRSAVGTLRALRPPATPATVENDVVVIDKPC